VGVTPFVRHGGRVAVVPRVNVDTDQIVPKQFLKRIERTGFAAALFHDWRYRADGSPDPAFELNRPAAAAASILLTGANFGCGSSREHAVWALREYGFRAVLGESFADIFYANCSHNGLLAVRLAPGEMSELFARHARADGRYDLMVDLEAQTVRDESGFHARFSIEPYRRDRLLRGLDEIDRTLLEDARIAVYERGREGEAGGSVRREEAW
jgi:3-isopropylmalate/(R)-2-methylmalate dehydratase small subunit